ncbi:MAG TPA: hypothetical protein VD902_03410, partial [Symbiobacteriaceae bacterium]|nr:hypothetical protein [Symbiobacteriaceae bacterium]
MHPSYERTSRLVLLAAFTELGLGLGLFMRPQEFQSPVYAPLWPHFFSLSIALFAGGAVLLERGRYRLPFWLQAALALVPAAPLGAFAVLLGPSGPLTAVVLYGTMAVAVLSEPW